MSELLGRGDPKIGDLSRHDAVQLEESLGALLARVEGVSWYEVAGSDVDLALARLCLLRRAKAGVGLDATAGDDGVRAQLEGLEPRIVVWLLSRAVSYMDEQGFPDFVPGARIE